MYLGLVAVFVGFGALWISTLQESYLLLGAGISAAWLGVMCFIGARPRRS